MEVFKSSGDVALRDRVSGHGGCGLGLVILEVFSNFNGSVVLQMNFVKFLCYLCHLLVRRDIKVAAGTTLDEDEEARKRTRGGKAILPLTELRSSWEQSSKKPCPGADMLYG